MARQPDDGPRYSSPEENEAAQRHRRRRVLVIELVVGLVAAAALFAVWWVLQPRDQSAIDGDAHTSIANCEAGDDGLVEAVVAASNGSDEYSNYQIEVVFDDADGDEVDRRTISILGVESGQTATDAVRTREAHEGSVSCRIDSALRLFAGAAPRG